MTLGVSFGETALRLARLSARVLGWRPDEFWAATPAELAAILGGESVPGLAHADLTRADLTRMMEHET